MSLAVVLTRTLAIALCTVFRAIRSVARILGIRMTMRALVLEPPEVPALAFLGWDGDAFSTNPATATAVRTNVGVFRCSEMSMLAMGRA